MATSGGALAFEGQRTRLVGLAYRMLGMRAEAEDVVQDAFLRWRQAQPAGIESPEAWLTTVVTRLAIDRLRSARMQREVYTGEWLPEPVVERRAWSAEARLEARQDLSIAFLYLLERLTPEERAAFLLREVFDHPYAQVAAILEKSEAACRQLVHRAKLRVQQGRPRVPAGPELQSKVLGQYVAALQAEDEAGLLRLLAADARLVADGGGKVRSALRIVTSGYKVARFFRGIWRKNEGRMTFEPALVNGQPGLLIVTEDQYTAAVSCEIHGGRIASLYVVSNPDKLRGVFPQAATGDEAR